MAVRPIVKLTRKQIYDEVWASAVSGMALKYSIPYSSIMKQIKDANIPVPPSGYWTKKEFNKETIMTPLPGDPDEVIALYKSSTTASKMLKSGEKEDISEKTAKTIQKTESGDELEKTPEYKPHSTPNSEDEAKKKVEQKTEESTPQLDSIAVLGEAEVEELWAGRTRNVYRREVLYKEVWQFPVVEVAKKYAVSDVTIHKICRALDIPTPPPGYWAKLRAGKKVSVLPLPKSDGKDVMTGSRTQRIYTPSTEEQIQHLSEEDRTAVMAVASELVMVDEHEKMNPKVAAYYKKVKTGQTMPVFSGIATETQPRALKILDTLVKTAIPLGVEIDDQLRFLIGADAVQISFSESTTEVVHQLTKEEKMALLEYEDAKRAKRWAREPKIRKYDHVYNGTLSLSIGDKRRFRDSKAGLVEERLGEALIAIFYCINEAKKVREEREEAERKREEERRRQEELRERYNKEVEKTNALVNQANDFEIASRIRAMVAAAEENGSASEEWIAWAKAKADWYDPTVAAVDEYFGRRNHKEDADEKKLRERRYSYYW